MGHLPWQPSRAWLSQSTFVYEKKGQCGTQDCVDTQHTLPHPFGMLVGETAVWGLITTPQVLGKHHTTAAAHVTDCTWVNDSKTAQCACSQLV
jgi:hypothetical protein